MRYRPPRNKWGADFAEDYERNLEDIERDITGVEEIVEGSKANAEQALTFATEAKGKAESVQAQFNQVVIEGDSSVEAAQARVDAKNVAQPTLKARLDKDYNEVTAQLADIAEPMPQNILSFGGSMNGTTSNDDAFNTARLVNRKSDYYGHVYFPNNEVGNATYYFTTTPFTDKTIISADDGVTLSFPSLTGKSFKNTKLNNDIKVVSRDISRTFTQKKSNYSDGIYVALSNNDLDIGAKKFTHYVNADLIKKDYFQDGSATVNGSVANYDSSGDRFKVSNVSLPSSANRYATTAVSATVGSTYNCAFKSLVVENGQEVRAGVLLALDNDKFAFYSIDVNKKLYYGLRNGSWSETVNDRYVNQFTDAYSLKVSVMLSVRVLSLNKFEIYVNGTYVDTITTPFNIAEVGFGVNMINNPSSGVNNLTWGKITYPSS